MSPAEILRARARAVGVDMSVEQANGLHMALRNHGYKVTARDIGESREVVLDMSGEKPDGTRDVSLCSQDPGVIWAKIWDEMA
jgi:hypothetical protein